MSCGMALADRATQCSCAVSSSARRQRSTWLPSMSGSCMSTSTRAGLIWRASAGTWVNVERGDYELARCHAVLGQGEAALRHARACLALVEQQAGDPQADAFETFFAHEALAWAQRAAGDTQGLADERAHMQGLMAQVADTSLKPWCEQALAALDA